MVTSLKCVRVLRGIDDTVVYRVRWHSRATTESRVLSHLLAFDRGFSVAQNLRRIMPFEKKNKNKNCPIFGQIQPKTSLNITDTTLLCLKTTIGLHVA